MDPTAGCSADIGFDVERRTVDGEVSLSEKRGGLVAALLERPDIEDLSMRLVARGDARAGNAELVVLTAPAAARANGKVTWEPKDGAIGSFRATRRRGARIAAAAALPMRCANRLRSAHGRSSATGSSR